ncbi:MAG TPA: DM13 domain-containing protein [Planctomycetota bacterium]|nr:DM13 domain-containing protein [Planctomycetota bacterium]
MQLPRILPRLLPLLLTAAFVAAASSPASAQVPARGDANSDLKIDISDPIRVLTYLFSGGDPPPCLPAADANADGRLDISDAVATLSYLFVGQGELLPLTEDETAECGGKPVEVVRSGRLIDILEPSHGIDGHAEELSNGKIRIRDFAYDGLGDPQVVVLLSKLAFHNEGIVISPDLRRDQPYLDETLEFPLPDGVTSSDFDYVEIWCDALPLTFGYATLVHLP